MWSTSTKAIKDFHDEDQQNKNNFVQKLWRMVTTEDPEIISFTPDGLSFHVKDPARLEQEVLPKYFRHSRFQSLVRQVNFYSFKKISSEREIWIYQHKLFQANKPQLLESLKRKPSASLIKTRVLQQQQRQHYPHLQQQAAARNAGQRRGNLGRPTISPPPSDSGMTSLESEISNSSSSGSLSKEGGCQKRKRKIDPSAIISRMRGGGPLKGLERGHSYGGTSSEYDEEEEEEDDEYYDENEREQEMRFDYTGGAPHQDGEQEEAGMEEGGDDGIGGWYVPEGKDEGVLYHGDKINDACEGYSEGEQQMMIDAEEEGMDNERKVMMEDRRINNNCVKEMPTSKKGKRAPSPPYQAKTLNPNDATFAVPPPSYTASAIDQEEWKKVTEQWLGAGEGSQKQLFDNLPTQQHTAFVQFFVNTAPYSTQSVLTQACQDLLSSCPTVAEALRQHRLALDPLTAVGKETFLAPSGAGVITSGHNDRALRDVLGYGINHLTESVVAASNLNLEKGVGSIEEGGHEEGIAAAAGALKDCLVAWRNHAGRLLL